MSSSSNQWRSAWLDVQLDDGSVVKDSFKKVDKAGCVFCLLCSKELNYSKEGLRSMTKHAKTQSHQQRLKTRKENQLLPGASNAHYPIFKDAVPKPTPPPLPRVSHQDRVVQAEALLLSFVAEHSLSFSLVPHIISLIKNLAVDKIALNDLSIDRTSASYKTTYGIAKTFEQYLVSSLKTAFFSLNIDEATSSNHKKVLTILVSYFSESQQKIVVDHLASISLITVNAQTVFDTVVNILESRGLLLTNMLSVLLDSCGVMRGNKSGFETRLRQIAPHLLDIDGDTCHHAHNAAKKFCTPFDIHILFLNIYNDFKWSPDLRVAMEDICLMLGLKFTMPERYVPQRWLSIFDVTVDVVRLLDAYIVFYYAFLSSKDDQSLYVSRFVQILQRRHCSPEARSRIREIRDQLRTKKMTDDGKLRKEKIVSYLFYHGKGTQLELHLLQSVLPLLKKYVILFQTKEPMCHILHDQQMRLLQQFLSCFMKPQHVPKSSSSLAALTIINDQHLLPPKQMFIGSQAKSLLSTCTASTAETFFMKLSDAYTTTGSYLCNKMPVDNLTLKCLSSLDPTAKGHSVSQSYMLKIPSIAPTVLQSDDHDRFELEVRNFHVSSDLPPFGEKQRIDIWWSQLQEKYPVLSKTALSLLSCFHGPQVESAFSIMNEILDPQSSRMHVDTLNAIQCVKYGLKAADKSSVSYFKRNDIQYDPVCPKLSENMRNSSKRYRSELEKQQEQLSIKRQKLSSYVVSQPKSKAKKLVLKAAQKARKKYYHRLVKLAEKRKLSRN